MQKTTKLAKLVNPGSEKSMNKSLNGSSHYN